MNQDDARDVAHDQTPGVLRHIRASENALIRALLDFRGADYFLFQQLENAVVRDARDGGMGSIEFAGNEHRTLSACLAQAEYIDSDGVMVSIVLNTDQNGLLYELDIWKVDFSPLRQYPPPERVTIKT